MIGVYIHIPFCLRKCPYCDFYSLTMNDALADAYTDAVCRAVSAPAIGAHPYEELFADTLYFGGGTPVLLGPRRLGRILDTAGAAFRLTEDAEITLEANPVAIGPEELAALRRAGFNRISFGVQSLHDGELSALGRLHTAEAGKRAILEAAEAGFAHISADLMLAVPGQTGESLAVSIDGLAALPVEHISAYLLKVEENTPFGQKKDSLVLPDDDAAADLYLACVERLEAYGFAQYEISNFARDGFISEHNLKYWKCREYLGVGPAAHSHLGGRRFYFPRDLDAFLKAGKPFDLAVDDGEGGGVEEILLLGLRLTEGVDLEDIPLSPGQRDDIVKKARSLERAGFTLVRGSRVSLTPQGFLLSNSVIAAMLDSL